MFDSGVIMILGFFTIVGCMHLIFRIICATKIANAGHPYNPRQQMWYNHKTQKLHFAEGSQRAAWWTTFWDNL